MKISNKYAWLQNQFDLPAMVKEAVRIGKLNTSEVAGAKSNSEILELAKIAGVADIYKSDETAWCAVAQTAICILANKEVPFTGWDRLRAKSFLKFGTSVKEPMLGDVLVFSRTGGGHVGMYIGEDSTHYHVAGGNQGNQYSIVRIDKSRLSGARMPKYNNIPLSRRKIFLSSEGTVSNNEA